jgi:ParB family chromosome partitioning protein
MGHARAILGIGDERRMANLARRVADEGLSVRAVEDLVRTSRAPGVRSATKSKRQATAPHVRQLEAELQRQLGTRVRIHLSSGNSGRIEIPFYGVEDFERVTDLLIGTEASRV